MDDIRDDIRELKSDVKEIKTSQTETNVQLTRYNTLLDEHIKRTQLLEMKVEPIENHVLTMHQIAKVLVWIVGVALALLGIFWR